MMRWIFLLFIAPLCAVDEAEVLRSLHAAQLVGDVRGALQQSEWAQAHFPDSQAVAEAHVQALAAAGKERAAIAALRSYEDRFGVDDNLTEKVAWGVIRRSFRDGTSMGQVFGLLAGATTRDVQAVELLLGAMRSSDHLKRAVGVQLAAQLRDAPLCAEVERLVIEERVWQVRAEAIRSAGRLRLHHLRPRIEAIIADKGTAPEERLAAIEAVAAMCDSVGREELQVLAGSRRAGLRSLACQLVAQLELRDDFDIIRPLLKDPRPDVRSAVLVAAGQLRIPDLLSEVRPLMRDSHSDVAITAAWFVTLESPEEGLAVLEYWLEQTHSPQAMHSAAGALRSTGRYGVPLAQRMLKKHRDPYVRANIALGLLGQRVDTDAAAQQLYAVSKEARGRWMWERERHPVLKALAPSRVRFSPGTPNQPEVVNQLTRLEVLSTLATAEHPYAQAAIREFLQERAWGVTGVAAVTLLEEGDEVALEAVRGLLDDSDNQIRIQAALALAVWGKDPGAASVLEEVYPTASRDMKMKILESLGHIGSRESIPFLQKTLDEPFASLRTVAASSLIQCINH